MGIVAVEERLGGVGYHRFLLCDAGGSRGWEVLGGMFWDLEDAGRWAAGTEGLGDGRNTGFARMVALEIIVEYMFDCASQLSSYIAVYSCLLAGGVIQSKRH